MNREEAKRKVVTDRTMHNVEKAIDKIYDDFESRVCGNCQWFNGHGECINIDILDMIGSIISPSRDFGCNKWLAEGKTE